MKYLFHNNIYNRDIKFWRLNNLTSLKYEHKIVNVYFIKFQPEQVNDFLNLVNKTLK